MNLEEAIARAKDFDIWNADGGSLDIILQAAVDGDLIPLSDHRLAVALAYKLAGEACDLPEHDAEERNWRDGAIQARRIRKAILALADADALAEVTRLRAQIEAADNLVKALWNVPSSPGLAAALSAYEATKGPKP